MFGKSIESDPIKLIIENAVEITWRLCDFLHNSGIKSFPIEKCGFECVNDWIYDKSELFEKVKWSRDWEDESYAEVMDEFCKSEIADLFWHDFEYVPMNPETEKIERDWTIFPKGTHREEIWHWFEDTFDLSVAEDLLYV